MAAPRVRHCCGKDYRGASDKCPECGKVGTPNPTTSVSISIPVLTLRDIEWHGRAAAKAKGIQYSRSAYLVELIAGAQ